MYLIDLSSFALTKYDLYEVMIMPCVRVVPTVIAGVLLFALLINKCLRGTGPIYSNLIDHEDMDESSQSDTEQSVASSRSNDSNMYISKVDKQVFDEIITSYKTLTCIVPSDNYLEEDASGVILSHELDGGVIIFEVQDTYNSYEEMIDNDFAKDRKYPPPNTKYYYLVYARLFLTRTYAPNNDSSTSLSDNENLLSQSDSSELPVTAFYYAKIDDDTSHQTYKRGNEVSLSADNSPKNREKEF